MLLFKKEFWDGLKDGSITLTFRRWQKARVKPGGRYRCHPIGVLEVDDIRLISVKEITPKDAQAAGFSSRAALIDYLGELGELGDDTEIYRVALHHGGDGDRVQLALEDQLTPEDIQEIRGKLERMDQKGPWTLQTLELIEKQPRIAASKLAKQVKRETAPFKADVVKLKKLGLTQSFEVGYEVAPRGKAYLSALRATSRRRS
ncbi:MAG: ASCH domain-containing protein [Polyangiaceae bacterium]